MKTQDDRTLEQKKTHRFAVVALDKYMSGWGGAKGGKSRVAWACAPDVDIEKVRQWVASRPEMKYVNVVDLSRYRPSKGTAHFQIYVCGKGHRAVE
jgi:hypothetical protein